MLPLLALTYTATRLGLEAQSAAAFRLLRLGAGIPKSADQIVPASPIPPADIAPAPVAAAPKRRYAAKRFTENRRRLGNAASGPSEGRTFFQFRPDLPTAPLVFSKGRHAVRARHRTR